MNDSARVGGRLRSTPARWLLAVALAVPLVMASLFLWLHQVKDLTGEAVEPPPRPLSDQQTLDQVLAAAREFVAAGRLDEPTASYALMPCRAASGPPYQGSVYVNFDVPTIAQTPAFFGSMIAGMTAHGWSEGVRPNDHPGGRTLGRDGVSAVFYRNPDVPGRGVLQIYGECSNMTSHDQESAGFIDVTGRLLN